MNPFLEVIVKPHWGKNQVVVSWTVVPDYVGGLFKVWRSNDGVTEFVEVGGGQAIDFIVDTYVPQDRISELFYRVDLQQNRQAFSSDTVGTFGAVSREEFGISQQVMRLEFARMQRCNKVKIFTQKLTGEPCICTDPDTGQRLGSSLCALCYGTGITGGYRPAVDSFALFVVSTPQVTIDVPSGEGSADPNNDTARMLPYPPLRKGDVVVDTDKDARWLVGEITRYSMNAKIPVVLDVTLHSMRRNDIRYQL